MKINNYIDGKPLPAIGGEFMVRSPYYDVSLELSNSCKLDLGDAIAAAKKGLDASRKISAEDRAEILRKTAKDIEFTQEEIEHFVHMQGIPVNVVRERTEYARNLLAKMGDVAEHRFGLHNGNLGRSVNGTGYELRLPPYGIACAFIPPNDPGESAFIYAHTVMAGGSVVLKPSQQEPLMAVKFADAVTKAGYPSGGINVIQWNTADETKLQFGKELLSRSSERIYMGEYGAGKELLAEYGGGILFSQGKSKAIVAEDSDLERVADALVKSSLDVTNSCVSVKTVLAVGKTAARLKSLLEERFRTRVCGDPLDETTQVGYLPSATLDQIERLMDGAKSFKYVEFVVPFERIGKHQMRPLLLTLPHTDPESQFVTQEFPYTLSLVPVNSLEAAVGFINESCTHVHEKAVMSVSLYAPEKTLELFMTKNKGVDGSVADLRTSMLYYNRPSTNMTPFLAHQGIDLTTMLTRPFSVIEGDA